MRVVSLFSGIGGFEEGLRLSKIDYEIVFASEIDKYARKSYSSNFSDKHLYEDIKDINEFDIPEHDLLVAGFPCQSFSIAGSRKGFDDIRGTLFFDIIRILKAKRPKVFLLENVKNLTSHDKGNTFKTMIQNLSNLGYSIDFDVLNSKDSGVPQSRERTFIIGVYNYEVQKQITLSKNKRVNEAKIWALNNEIKLFVFFNTLVQQGEPKVLSDIIYKNVDKKYYIKNEKITEFLNEIKIPVVTTKNEIIKLFDLPKEVHNDMERQRRVYSVMGISPTVLARADSTKIYLEENGEKVIRKITPIENFLAQGFSLNFVNKLSKAKISDTQLYKQSGNAVSPPIIRDIILHIDKFNMLNNTEEKFKFIDLFSGIGGFRIAMESLGGKCVLSSEIDKHAVETYFSNFNEMPIGDITKVNVAEIPDHDVLCAGFPCQPFSIGGLRKGFEDTRGTLFFDVARIIKEKKPKVVFLENVAGIVSHDSGNTLRVIINSLEELEYKVHYKVMNASDYGIPQNRNRWYCIAVRSDIDFEYKFPEKVSLKYTLKDIIEYDISEKYNITDVAKSNIDKFIEEFKISNRYNQDEVLIANEVRKSRCNFRCDGISPCLTAKMGTGGNNVPIVTDQNRKLTEKECLRIMGFPSWYNIAQNKMQSYKQIGNSVVVPIIKMIGDNFIKIL
ncbi:DNA (cytosine-5-)-methyltransferase [Macrococcoides caseolyticum]|uniref:DNA (cytosine-5-)-methyltransferase n=1 Tax=Macrococcoides caseolyticum TaxID=69966 RepID=UPI001314B5DD|nr:DNA (cytosine-5-)-methyltransferase [Macrococcus caseolyticus]